MPDIGALSKLVRLGKEGIGRWVDAARPYAESDDVMSRLQALLKDIPQTAELFAPRAVVPMLNSSSVQVRGLSPREFLDLAYPLDTSDKFTQNTLAHYADLVRSGKWSEPEPGIFNDRYLRSKRAEYYQGLSSIPYLNVTEKPMSWLVGGHEGRHRMNVAKQLYGEDVQVPTAITSSGALTHKFPSIVTPEDAGYSRGNVDLSKTKRYVLGGLAQNGR